MRAAAGCADDTTATGDGTVSNGKLRHRTASRLTPAAPRPCIGCGGAVPDIAGPTHSYMRSSPGCWATYGEVCARVFGTEGRASDGRHVDCYAVQHPGGAEHDSRQRSSVAVHLTALCLDHQFAIPTDQVTAIRARMSRIVLPQLGRSQWPYLLPPTGSATTTVADVHTLGNGHQLIDRIEQWAAETWSAWDDHHATVHEWAAAAARTRQ